MKEIDEALKKFRKYTYVSCYGYELDDEYNTIKQGIIDRDNRIKELELDRDGAVEDAMREVEKVYKKLSAIEKVANDIDRCCMTNNEVVEEIKDILNDN